MNRAILFCLMLVGAYAAPLRLPRQDLPKAIAGVRYDTDVKVLSDCRCPGGDTGLWVAEGALPRGLEISPAGLTGVPQEAGIFHFVLGAANHCSEAVQDFALVVTGRPVLEVEPQELVFEYRAGEAAPAPKTFLVSGTWSGLPYSVAAGAEWLGARQAAGTTPREGSALSGDAVLVRINPEKLAPGTYKAAVVVSTWRGANAPAVPVTLKVIPGK